MWIFFFRRSVKEGREVEWWKMLLQKHNAELVEYEWKKWIKIRNSGLDALLWKGLQLPAVSICQSLTMRQPLQGSCSCDAVGINKITWSRTIANQGIKRISLSFTLKSSWTIYETHNWPVHEVVQTMSTQIEIISETDDPSALFHVEI